LYRHYDVLKATRARKDDGGNDVAAAAAEVAQAAQAAAAFDARLAQHRLPGARSPLRVVPRAAPPSPVRAPASPLRALPLPMLATDASSPLLPLRTLAPAAPHAVEGPVVDTDALVSPGAYGRRRPGGLVHRSRSHTSVVLDLGLFVAPTLLEDDRGVGDDAHAALATPPAEARAPLAEATPPTARKRPRSRVRRAAVLPSPPATANVKRARVSPRFVPPTPVSTPRPRGAFDFVASDDDDDETEEKAGTGAAVGEQGEAEAPPRKKRARRASPVARRAAPSASAAPRARAVRVNVGTLALWAYVRHASV
jgi:hypothetical protein